jgi:hypothetical protein
MTVVKAEHLNLSIPEFDDYDSTYVPNYTVSHLRKQQTSRSLPWELQMSHNN